MDGLVYLHSWFQTGATTWQRWWQGNTQGPPTCMQELYVCSLGGKGLGMRKNGKLAVYVPAGFHRVGQAMQHLSKWSTCPQAFPPW